MQLLKTYFRFVPAAKRKLSLVILMAVVGAIFQGASVGLLIPALEIVESPDGQERSGLLWKLIENVYDPLGIPVNLLALLVSVLAMIVIGQALIYGQKHLSASMSEGLVAGFRRHAYSTFMRADLAFHHSLRSGVLTNSLTQDVQRTGATFDSLLDMMSRLILLVVFIAALFLVSWSTSLTAIGILVLAALVIQYHIRISGRLGQQMVDTHKEFHGFTAERIEAARLVKVSNALERDVSRFGRIVGSVASVRTSHLRRGAQIRFILEPSLAAGGLVATYIGLKFFNMSLPELAAFLYILVRMVPEAHSLNRSRFNVAGYVKHFDNATSLIRQAEEQTTIKTGPRTFEPLSRDIVFDNVSFTYDSASSVIQNVDLTIEAGKLTAIVGPSGVGKSTTLDLMIRLVEPTQGRVLLDGVDIREYELVSLRHGVALVSQDILLWNDTVLENIRYAWPEASEEDAVEAAVKANAHSFIEELPQGYNTLLGPRGMTISGGERQRIALARALLQKPSVLLLDEVTSNLDAESERLIQESVLQAAKDRTVVAVTHRLSTVQRADKVVVFDQGRVVEEGPPEVLANGKGLFHQYVQIQMGTQLQ